MMRDRHVAQRLKTALKRSKQLRHCQAGWLAERQNKLGRVAT